MKRLTVALFAMIAMLFGTFGVADAAVTWGDAQAVPGLDTLGQNGSAISSVILCPTAELCAALGRYNTAPDVSHGFKTGVMQGTWVDATDISGLEALNTGGSIDITASGCAPETYCVIAGTYSDGPGQTQGFVLASDGSPAVAIPGLAALNLGNQVFVNSVACSSVGNCVVVGSYTDGSNVLSAFYVELDNGVWQNAASLGTAGALKTVSCWADGECVAAGWLTNGVTWVPAAMTRSGGGWTMPVSIQGVNVLGTGEGSIDHLSCPVADTCFGIGVYSVGQGQGVFTTSLSNGTWSNAVQLGGIASLDTGGYPVAVDLSCWTATSCLSAGNYSDATGTHGWSAEITGGTWGSATDLPVASDFGSDGTTYTTAMSCASDGMCAIVGLYGEAAIAPGSINTLGGANVSQGFVSLRDPSGTMLDAMAIPGLAALNTGGYADPKSVSCTIGFCGISGFFYVGNDYNAFVATMTITPDPEPTTTTTSIDPVAPAFTG